ncbi:MAG: GNAT family N-acetyltransferase [Candidatus Moraniibacteriota bacterium]|jgi:ribosomal protein S18 acetylase RimI-like enzyme
MDIIVKRLAVKDNLLDVQKLFLQLTRNCVTKDYLRQCVYDDHCICFVVKDSGKIISFCALTVRLVPSQGSVGTIEDVIVDKSYLRQGIGSAMIDYLISEAKKLKLCRLELTSNSARKAAIQLYQQKGFEKNDTNVFKMML